MEKYNVEFYEDHRGRSEVKSYVDSLSGARLERMLLVIEYLEIDGTRVGHPLVGWLVKGNNKMWELRVNKERFPFFQVGNTIILVSHFTKKDEKTPSKELRKAIRLRQDWIKRNS